ncbi:UNVERIFIED_CONTAM: hypothetical protein Sangu_2523000 [Sesamum angustifolium]|uniref:Uncharacterized protein n=1 Tax=Sesamum angustifolium TaxID=2727405 RepID=A0AAW2JGR3_9LAMI
MKASQDLIGMTGIPDLGRTILILGLEASWQSRACKDCILEMASGRCVVRHVHHKSYPVQSEHVARTMDSKRGSSMRT